MPNIFWKIIYVISRSSAIFSLPFIRSVRNLAYSKHLKTNDLNVDDFVRINPAHYNPDSFIIVKSGLRVGRNAEIDFSGGLKIGERVSISEDAKIYTHDHDIDGQFVDWRKNSINFKQLDIEDDVWIGAGAMILSDVSRIGKGAIIAAGAVVNKDVETLSIVAGIPARIVRYRSNKEQ